MVFCAAGRPFAVVGVGIVVGKLFSVEILIDSFHNVVLVRKLKAFFRHHTAAVKSKDKALIGILLVVVGVCYGCGLAA